MDSYLNNFLNHLIDPKTFVDFRLPAYRIKNLVELEGPTVLCRVRGVAKDIYCGFFYISYHSVSIIARRPFVLK